MTEEKKKQFLQMVFRENGQIWQKMYLEFLSVQKYRWFKTEYAILLVDISVFLV